VSAAATVSLAEYLSTSYRPDCDYLEGIVVERNLGEFDHSRLQYLIAMALGMHEQELDAYVLPEQRVQVRATRFRIPDVCLIRREDRAPIIRNPPLLCVEILSPEDTKRRTKERIDDYLAMGVPTVWLVDPKLRLGYVYSNSGRQSAVDGVLWADGLNLRIDLAPLFAQL
jgi:Uma2 family endonuclease